MANNRSPLQIAMEGGEVSEKQAKSALGDAVGKIASLTKKNNITKEQMEATGEQVVNTGLTQGSLFLASLAEGYFGPDKMKVGGVDMRAGLGVAATGYGLYQTITGEDGGATFLAAGNGVFGSWLASVGRDAGQTLAEKRDKAKAKEAAPSSQPADPAAQAQPAATPPAAMPTPATGGLLPEPQVIRALPQPQPDHAVQGPMREVLLTPRGESGDGRRREGRAGDRSEGRGRSAQGRPSRFVRAAPLHDDDE